MTCMIHYEELRKYDDLFPVIAKISEKILRAKKLHEDKKDEHEPQGEQIPTDGLTTYYFYRNPCYKKFVKIIEKSKSTEALSKPVEKTSKASVKTRSKRKSTTKFHDLPITTKKRKTQPATRQVCRRGSAFLATSSFRNKLVFRKDCVVCNKFELRYKNKDRDEIREYPLMLKLDALAKAIVKMLEMKQKYKELREKTILVTDFISAEFKCHENSGKN